MFLAFENSSYETAKARLEAMKIVAKHKRKAAEQAELDAWEAENDVLAIELEIEVVKRHGCIEETFWRFPHIGEQIFEELDETTLFKCLEINKWWQKIIIDRKIRQINQLEKHTYINASILKRALGNKDFETVQKLANYSMKVYRKVIVDVKNNNGISHEESDSTKQQEEIVRYLFEKKQRDSTQQMLTELMLKNTMKKTLTAIQPLIQNGDFELLQMFFETFFLKYKNLYDFYMRMCKKVYLRWNKGDYSGEHIHEAILTLYPCFEGFFNPIK